MTDWSTLKKLIWLRIIKGGGIALRTVTGAIVHVTNALALPAEALTVNVEPIQDLHGYDSPWPAGGGKNLLDPLKCSAIGSSSTYGLTVTHDQATETWTISGTPTSQNASLGFNFCTYSDFSLSGKGYLVQSFLISGMPIKNVYGFRNENENKIAIVIDTVANPTVNMTFKVSVSTTSQTAWSPYSNICPISGRTSATVTRTGKNLLNPSQKTDYSSGYGQRWYKSEGFTLKANQTYTFSVTTDKTIALYIINKDSRTDIVTGNNRVTYTPSADTVVYFQAYRGEDISSINAFQLELGSTASAYEPYTGNTYTINLDGTRYGGTLDVTGGKIVVDRAVKTIGELNFIYQPAQNRFYTTALVGVIDVGNGNIVNILSEALQGVPWINNTYEGPRITAASSGNVFIHGVQYTSTIELTNAIGSTKVMYRLATPIEITLTATQIDMLLGENNLWADAGDLTLTYYADGNASTSEALGILLGGTYNNPGGADDVSDDEALGILLGGS